MASSSRNRFSTEASLKGPAPLQVLDEAIAFLRRTPLSLHLIYYAGALPFCASLVYFVSDMLQSAEAEQHLVSESLLVTLAYFWMKTCQAVFSRRLLATLEGQDAEPWTLQRWINTAVLQSIVAATFFFVWPLALVTTIPFGWVHAFYHNVSIVGTGRATTLRGCLTEAATLSTLWPKQNHLVLGVMLAGLFVLLVNIAVFLAMLPRLLDMLFGLSTVFDESFSAWNNSSFYLDVAVLVFLVLNPLSKAVYVLRCFYGRARLNGADLRAGLQRLRTARPAAVALVAVLVLSSVAHADDATPPVAARPAPAIQVPPETLDHALQSTLQKDEFAWRAPKPPEGKHDDSFIERVVHQFFHLLHEALRIVFKPIGEFLRWLLSSSREHDGGAAGTGVMGAIPWGALFWVALVLVVAVLVGLVVRNLRPSAISRATPVRSTPVKTIDLESESVRADALPEDLWLALAQELLEKGETRLALRALYLATLSLLAQRELIRLGAAKSNRDYLQELIRRLRERTDAVSPFRGSIRLFEASWYGTHAVTLSVIESMRANHQTVRSHVAA
jgi:hypothetical protein